MSKKVYHTLVLTDGQLRKIVSALYEQAMRDSEEEPWTLGFDRVVSSVRKISAKNAEEAKKK